MLMTLIFYVFGLMCFICICNKLCFWVLFMANLYLQSKFCSQHVINFNVNDFKANIHFLYLKNKDKLLIVGGVVVCVMVILITIAVAVMVILITIAVAVKIRNRDRNR